MSSQQWIGRGHRTAAARDGGVELLATVDASCHLKHEYNNFEGAGVLEHDIQTAVIGMHQAPPNNLETLLSLCALMTISFIITLGEIM